MRYFIGATGAMIDGSTASCTGSQLYALLCAIRSHCDLHRWYFADVQPDEANRLLHLSGADAQGATALILDSLPGIAQFLSGVFLGYESPEIRPVSRSVILTDDPEDADMGNAVVEIRAFDTTSFEILTIKNCVVEAVLGIAPSAMVREVHP